ncbi:phosphatase PAP2 family protein [Aestuariivirga litoralis]|uniref:phosphatase PAP2 family protein n=1 Tax=Aestuariivirga litoralis TaxID=2650924 RepID=UPI0018C69130|nr:phosphatase PAP2 family protein [Aestuariivirga litoralis]MBG1231993.1 phosphatase PAP2 family protein [Aestuariivirga litoralis]
MDNAITQWINAPAGQNDLLDPVALATTTYGVPLMVLFVIALWWLGSPAQEVRHGCIAAGMSFLLGLGSAQIMLLFIHRIRPYEAGVSHLIVPPTADWSFPSDHAIASTSIVFALLLNRVVPVWTLVLAAMAALVCVSRIYVGMHYVSDIAGGAGVALIAALIVQFAYRRDTAFDRWLVSRF